MNSSVSDLFGGMNGSPIYLAMLDWRNGILRVLLNIVVSSSCSPSPFRFIFHSAAWFPRVENVDVDQISINSIIVM